MLVALPFTMLSIQNVSKRFSGVYALKDLNLEIEEGDSFGLIGPNGAGKTTLIRIISGLIKPDSGEVSVSGYDLDEDPIKVKNLIGVVSHNLFLYPDLTARENLLFYSRLYNLTDVERRVEELLTQVGLILKEDELVGRFSRGMSQRLSLARALIHDPPILILDEPTTGLDISGKRDFYGWVKSFKEKGKTILITSHDMEEIRTLSTSVGVLIEGQLIEKTTEIGDDLEERFIDLTTRGIK